MDFHHRLLKNITPYQGLHKNTDVKKGKDQIDGKDPILEEHAAIIREKAAIVFQKYIRQYLTDKPFLFSNLYPNYLDEQKKIESPEENLIPRASHGRVKVYLPKTLPQVVFKLCNPLNIHERLNNAQNIRAILNSQNSSHLIIPRAMVSGNFLIEQRLPMGDNLYQSMLAYITEPQLFDQVVREMTHLYSRVWLGDIIDADRKNPLSCIEGVNDYIRYDNFPLYIEEQQSRKVGKLGLIDLEDIRQGPREISDLVRIFPYHVDIIREEALKLNFAINEDALKLNTEKGKKFLQVAVKDYSEWLRKKGISSHSSYSLEIHPQRIEELTKVIEKELLSLNQQKINDIAVQRQLIYIPPFNIIFKEPREKLANEHASTFVSSILNNIKSIIDTNKTNILSKMPDTNFSESQLITLRSPVVKKDELYKGVWKVNIYGFENVRIFSPSRFITEHLCIVIFNELIKGGEIFYFDPALASNRGDKCWIRY